MSLCQRLSWGTTFWVAKWSWFGWRTPGTAAPSQGEVWEPLGDKGLGQGEVGELRIRPPLIPVLPFYDLTAGFGWISYRGAWNFCKTSSLQDFGDLGRRIRKKESHKKLSERAELQSDWSPCFFPLSWNVCLLFKPQLLESRDHTRTSGLFS